MVEDFDRLHLDFQSRGREGGRRPTVPRYPLLYSSDPNWFYDLRWMEDTPVLIILSLLFLKVLKYLTFLRVVSEVHESSHLHSTLRFHKSLISTIRIFVC